MTQNCMSSPGSLWTSNDKGTGFGKEKIRTVYWIDGLRIVSGAKVLVR